MRRTEQEFKAELLKRTQAYRQQRAKKRKTLIGIGMCACICYAALIVVAPMGGASNDTAAADMITAGGSRTESAMSQSQESGWEYCQEAPAVMEDEMADAGEPAEEAVTKVIGTDDILVPGAEDAAVILEYLRGEWVLSAANCQCDYTLDLNGAIYRYHSDCGTFQDENAHSLTVSEDARQVINAILEAYADQEMGQ